MTIGVNGPSWLAWQVVGSAARSFALVAQRFLQVLRRPPQAHGSAPGHAGVRFVPSPESWRVRPVRPDLFPVASAAAPPGQRDEQPPDSVHWRAQAPTCFAAR